MNRARNLLRSVLGNECWSVIAGPGTGSHLVLDIGRKIQLPEPIRNPLLSEESRRYKGEFTLFLEDCAWRVENEEGILCTSKSENSLNGEMLSAIRQLIGARIIRAEIETFGFDLLIAFDKKLVLRTFSDTASDESGDNYTYSSPEGAFTVSPKGKFHFRRST